MNLAAHTLAGTIARVVAACLIYAAPFARAAAIGLTVSPAAITNDYIGKFTLNITNLTAGKTVTVDSYADLNTNGIIDAGDLLTKSFQLTDGQVPKVSGVRHLNLPGDEDGLTNGQIQTFLQFPTTGGGIPLVKGLLRVSDPAGSLTSVTQAFSIAQKFYPQGVTGRITLAGTGLPLTNSIVGLPGLAGTVLDLTPTDTNGNYRFYCVPGIYVVTGFNSKGAVFNEAAIVSVGCGQTITNNLVVTKGTFYVAGRVTDSGSGLGIPALTMDADTGNNLGVHTWTDTNGNYALQVTPNTWSVHPSTGSTPEAGYVDATRVDVPVTSASVSNVNFALSKPTAMIYGTIKDTLNNPVLGVQLSARDQFDNFHVLGRSFATNTSYSLGVLAGTWNPAPDSSDLGRQGFTGHSSNVTLIAGQVTNLNYVVTRTNWPSLQSPLRLSNSQFQFLLNGLAGQNYTIQSATNLGVNDWQVVLATNLPCNTALILDPHATNSARFYRALVGP